jgi:DNA-binding MarR family transcriptional regulator
LRKSLIPEQLKKQLKKLDTTQIIFIIVINITVINISKWDDIQMEVNLNKQFATLRHFSNILMRQFATNSTVGEFDFKLSQLKAISAFEDNNPQTMKALAENAMVKLPNMTTMVDSLIKEGLAERKKSGLDRRKVLVTLTPKGQEIRNSFMASRRRAAVSTFSMLGDEDKKELLHCLDRVCTILEKTVVEKKS